MLNPSLTNLLVGTFESVCLQKRPVLALDCERLPRSAPRRCRSDRNSGRTPIHTPPYAHGSAHSGLSTGCHAALCPTAARAMSRRAARAQGHMPKALICSWKRPLRAMHREPGRSLPRCCQCYLQVHVLLGSAGDSVRVVIRAAAAKSRIEYPQRLVPTAPPLRDHGRGGPICRAVGGCAVSAASCGQLGGAVRDPPAPVSRAHHRALGKETQRRQKSTSSGLEPSPRFYITH